MDEPPQSVRNAPGSMMMTVMPSGAHLVVQHLGEALDGELGRLVRGEARRAADAAADRGELKDVPDRCARSTGRAALVTLTTPKKFVSTCARKSSSEVSSMGDELA